MSWSILISCLCFIITHCMCRSDLHISTWTINGDDTVVIILGMYSWTHDGSQWVNICVIFTMCWLLWSYNLILIRCGAKGIVWSGLIFDSSKAFDRISVLLFSAIRCGGHGAFLWPIVLVLCGWTKVTGIWFNAPSLKDASNEDVD